MRTVLLPVLLLCVGLQATSPAQVRDAGARAVQAHSRPVSFLAAATGHVVTAADGEIAIHALPSLALVERISTLADAVGVSLHEVAGVMRLRMFSPGAGALDVEIPSLEGPGTSGGTTTFPCSRRPWPGDRFDFTGMTMNDDWFAVATSKKVPGVGPMAVRSAPKTAPFAGHAARLADVSLRGDLLATSSWDGTLRTWTMDGREQGFRDDVPTLTRILWVDAGLVGCDDEGRLWFVPDPTTALPRAPFGGALGAAARSASGLLATGSTDNLVRVFDETGAMTALTGHGAPVTAIAFAGERRLVSTDADGTILHFDVEDGDDGGRSTSSPINALATGGGRIATGHRTHEVRLRGATTKETRYLHEDDVKGLAFSPDGSYLASTSDDGAVRAWSQDTGDVLLGTHPRAGHSVAWSPDGKRVASGCLDGHVRIWSHPGGELLATHGPFERGVNQARYDASGDRLVVSSSDGSVTVLDGRTGEALGPPHRHDMAAVWAEFVDDETVFAAHTDGVVVFLEWKTGRIVRRLGRTASRVAAITARGADSCTVSLASGRTAFWSADGGVTEVAPVAATAIAEAPALSITLDDDGVVIARDAEGRDLWIRCVPGRPRVAAVSGNRVLLGCDDGLVVVLDRATGARASTFRVEESR